MRPRDRGTHERFRFAIGAFTVFEVLCQLDGRPETAPLVDKTAPDGNRPLEVGSLPTTSQYRSDTLCGRQTVRVIDRLCKLALPTDSRVAQNGVVWPTAAIGLLQEKPPHPQSVHWALRTV